MAKCDYKRPDAASKLKSINRIGYITVLYYLMNDGWSLADMGETGIYSRSNQPVSQIDIAGFCCKVLAFSLMRAVAMPLQNARRAKWRLISRGATTPKV